MFEYTLVDAGNRLFRSFSFFKRIKNTLRSSLCQKKLDALGVLSVENDINANINFEEWRVCRTRNRGKIYKNCEDFVMPTFKYCSN